MSWWSDNNFRMIQNNMVDPNAAMNVDQWIADLKSFHCNVVMVGVGGITSFFPSKLPYQVPSPYLPEGRDLIREMLDKCHTNGIRLIGRFDFGRTNQKFFAEHDDWFYHAADGHMLYCSDTITTCINGPYQQELSLEIVREALQRYPDMDGVFFNAFGFAGWDFFGNQHGPCHCIHCKRLFKEFSGGMDLPLTDASDEPSMPIYRRFQRKVIAETLSRIQQVIRSISPKACLCTYSTDGVDLIRNESNTGIGRSYPFPLMSASFNLIASRASWPETPMANCVINATDLRWRYSGVSPYLTKIRLYENIASGGCLDFCINGIFEDYPDQASLDPVRKVFCYHAEHEEYYGHYTTQAKLAIIRTENGRPINDGTMEMFGIMKALKEEHILFEMLLEDQVTNDPTVLDRYTTVIISDVNSMRPDTIDAIRCAGKKLIITAMNRPLTDEMSRVLEFQIDRVNTDNAGAYLATREKDIFRHFAKKEWIFFTGGIGFAGKSQYTPMLPYVDKGNFGPAERAYGYKPTEIGTIWSLHNGEVTIITWPLGMLYHQYGYQDHKYILSDLLDAFAPEVRVIETDAHPSLEIFWDDCGKGMILQALNLSGFNGTTIERPVPMTDVSITIPICSEDMEVLTDSQVSICSAGDGWTKVTFSKIDEFAAVVFH